MEHLAGKGIDLLIQFRHSRRLKRWKAETAPFYVKDNLKRFSLLASAVTGQNLRVIDIKGDTPPKPYLPILYKMAHPALLADHGFGWSDGETIFLPVSIVDMQTEDKQEKLAKILLFFLSTQISHGSLTTVLENRSLFEKERLVADLYWIIENTRLYHSLKKDFPGLFNNWEELTSYLMGRRPTREQLNRAERRVEEFFEESIKVTIEGAPVPGSAMESFSMARSIKNKWFEEGLPIKRYRGMVPFTPWGKLIPDRIKDGFSTGTPADESKEQEKTPDGREHTDKKNNLNRYMAKREEVDEEANDRGLMLNIYDKILSWAEFVNVQRPFDDDPENNNARKADEMEELTTVELKRSTNTFFDAELERGDSYTDDNSGDDQKADKVYLYPEWDYRTQRYRDNYSRVTESTITATSVSFVEDVLRERCGIIKEVRRKFEMLTPDVKLMTRQFDGENIDIDAAVEAAVDFEAGMQPSEKLYTSYMNTERDLSVLFLIDLSMSTDAWINDRRVIDHEKEAMVVLCEALDKLRDRYAIYGFSGKTHKGCRFFHIKGFKEQYDRKVKARIGELIPCQYTRMGPAIRHAAEVLKKQPSKIKLLFLISDGKPNDIDAYEGRYGVEDSRMAVKEVEAAGIVPFCLTVDNTAHEYLGHIFGKGNHTVLSGVERLIKKLPELYARIIKNL